MARRLQNLRLSPYPLALLRGLSPISSAALLCGLGSLCGWRRVYLGEALRRDPDVAEMARKKAETRTLQNGQLCLTVQNETSSLWGLIEGSGPGPDASGPSKRIGGR